MKMKPLPDRRLLMIVAALVIGAIGQKRNNLYLVAEIMKVVLEMGFEEWVGFPHVNVG